MRLTRPISVSVLAASLAGPTLAQFELAPDSTTIPRDGARVHLDTSGPIPIIQASVNGEGPFPFILDTGAAGVVLSEAFAKKLGMKVVGTQQVRDMASGTDVDCDQVTIERVEIGGATLRGLGALLMNMKGMLGASGDAPRGIIGRSTFANCLFTMDYPGSTLLIEEGHLPPADGRTILSYELEDEDRTPRFTADVAGTRYETHIDTGGMTGITLPFDQMKSLPLDGEPTVMGRARGAGGTFEFYGSKLNGTVTLGGYSWESPRVTFAPNIQWVHLGTDVLKRFSITWDQRNRRARFHDPSDVVTDQSQTRRPRRYGIQMNPEKIGDGPLIVDGVVEGMAAERSGLRAGDRILTIDGKSVSGLSQLELATIFRRPKLDVTVDRAGQTIAIVLSLD